MCLKCGFINLTPLPVVPICEQYLNIYSDVLLYAVWYIIIYFLMNFYIPLLYFVQIDEQQFKKMYEQIVFLF